MLAPGRQISQKSVLLLAPQPFFLNRGTPINVRAMATVLAEIGYQVDLLVYPFGDHVEIEGVRILRSPSLPFIRSVPIGPSWRKIFLDVLLLGKSLVLCARKRYAAIQGVEEAGFMSWFLGRVFRTPSIFDMDSCMVAQLESSGFLKSGFLLRAVSALEHFCISRSAAVITVCQALTEKVRSFSPASNIFQIEDFPIEDLDLPSEAAVNAMRAKHAPAGEKLLIYTGNLEAYQGIDLVLEAFADVVRSGKLSVPARLLFVGGEDHRVSHYRARAAELQIATQVFFAGQRPSSEMGIYMAAADALLSPRLVGSNTPLKLYSYMTTGKPIVATSIESHTQVLDNTSAFLGDPTPQSYGEALMRVLDGSIDGKQEAGRRAARAKELVEQKYSKACFTEKLRGLYAELVGNPFSDPEAP